ncbi:hypothetical protein E2C01_044635 [Portunus trituberculatus]|uniref:Uncharacterized protein n=1 Tax=Portunus trituberculatus TaxID=210409 RepID=A0A5B7FTM2_PORTR|nr:hypothetical protein [Portunus trituberculatus]
MSVLRVVGLEVTVVLVYIFTRQSACPFLSIGIISVFLPIDIQRANMSILSRCIPRHAKTCLLYGTGRNGFKYDVLSDV